MPWNPLLSRCVLVASILAFTAGPAQAAPKVVASIPPVHSLVAAVMDGVAEPRLLVEGGQSPHTYSLRPTEAAELEGADLVVWVGPTLEVFLQRPLRALSDEARVLRLVDADGLMLLETRAGGVWEEHGHDHGHDHGHGHDHDHDHNGHADHHHGDDGGHSRQDPMHGEDQDKEHAHADDRDGSHDHGHGSDGRGHGHGHEPRAEAIDSHVWLDPDNAKAIVRTVAARLVGIDPDNTDTYEANAQKTKALIDEVDGEVAALLADVRDAPYIVFHDAYQYFERRYGLSPAGSITLSPDRQPSAGRLHEIRQTILERDARCVFSEPQFTPQLVETVSEGTPARPGVLDPLGAGLEPGPEAYPRLLRNLAGAIRECLVRAG